jgi:hypothetical protein
VNDAPGSSSLTLHLSGLINKESQGKQNKNMESKNFERALLITSGLIGLGLIFIGIRFLVAPETGERDFSENADYSFHYIKGVRDLFCGALILTLALWKRRAELALTLTLGAMIPFVDFLVVLNAPNSNPAALWIHGVTAIVLVALAGFLFRSYAKNSDALTAARNASSGKLTAVLKETL